ncbi:MAG TPA: FadR family transcriptional regulator, partial [Desulfobacteraceae bacterium]|nr:FadR family transcriptional regulator [Desulfobacteraceae bacterium]
VSILNVSRPSLREALKSLVGMGYLEITQGNRTIIRSLASGRILEPLDLLVKEDVVTALELIEVRKAIEAWNGYHAAKRATDEEIARLERCAAAMEPHLEDADPSFGKNDADFHLEIARASHNKVQTHIMFTIYDLLKNFIARFYGKMNSTTIFKQHIRIVNAIKQRDPDKTRQEILDHLDYVETCIREALGINGDFHNNGEGPSLDVK